MSPTGPHCLVLVADPALPRSMRAWSRPSAGAMAAPYAGSLTAPRSSWCSTPARAARTWPRPLAGHELDWALVPAAGRKKRLLVSDMDSTIIDIECIDELADFVGIKAEVAAITGGR